MGLMELPNTDGLTKIQLYISGRTTDDKGKGCEKGLSSYTNVNLFSLIFRQQIYSCRTRKRNRCWCTNISVQINLTSELWGHVSVLILNNWRPILLCVQMYLCQLSLFSFYFHVKRTNSWPQFYLTFSDDVAGGVTRLSSKCLFTLADE